jgi:hypothetical protein
MDTFTLTLSAAGTITAACIDELGIPREAVRKLITEISDRAFGDFSPVIELSLPNCLIRIRSFALLGCKLHSSSLPDSLDGNWGRLVNEQSWDRSSSHLAICLSMTSFDWSAEAVKEFAVDADNPVFMHNADGILRSKDSSKIICCPRSRSSESHSVPTDVMRVRPPGVYSQPSTHI